MGQAGKCGVEQALVFLVCSRVGVHITSLAAAAACQQAKAELQCTHVALQRALQLVFDPHQMAQHRLNF